MFSAARMMHLSVVVLERDERAVLTDLGRLGVVQLTRAWSESDATLHKPRDCTRDLGRCDRIRAMSEELRQALEIPPPTGEWEPAEMTLAEAEEKLLHMKDRIRDLLERRRQLVQRRKEVTALCERVSDYRGLDFPLDGPDGRSFLHFVAGSLPVENLGSLAKEVGGNTALIPVAQQKGRQTLVAITTRRGEPALGKALQEAGFQRESFPEGRGTTVDTLWEEGERERRQTDAELEQVNGDLHSLAAEFAPPVTGIESLADIERRLLEASQKFPRTEAAVLLSGWVPADDVSAVERKVGEITGGRYAIRTMAPDDSEKERVPVLLKHSRFLRPFEVLVSTYGLPDYRELEPTIFVALSYMFMFAMMFGDAGHGAVLASCGLVALLAGRSEKARDLGLLLIIAGSSSIISGVVYGSYFGIALFRKYALWHDPLEGDPMPLMYGAIGFGVVMMSLGLILNVINRFRQGDVIGGFLDRFGLAGLLFYWGALALMMNWAAIRSSGLLPLSITLFLVVPIVGWAVKEPVEYLLSRRAGARQEAGEGGLPSAATESLVGAFEAVLTYLANTISFVRLAAYAMSHAALLVAAFILAHEVRDFSFGGSLWSLVIIIFGNLIAIVLEGIIASVQALRLEYYEFFGKFFSGSGQPFEPFRLTAESKARVARG